MGTWACPMVLDHLRAKAASGLRGAFQTETTSTRGHRSG